MINQMKTIIFRQYVSIFIQIILFASILTSCNNGLKERKFEARQRKALIGTYVFDAISTKQSVYKNNRLCDLRLTLYKNGSFSFNKKMPFIYDSSGIWIPRKPGLDQWNYLIFSYRLDSNHIIKLQFADSWKSKENDSGLFLNSVTPMKDSVPLHAFFMKKISYN
jgi:hypothetical protein